MNSRYISFQPLCIRIQISFQLSIDILLYINQSINSLLLHFKDIIFGSTQGLIFNIICLFYSLFPRYLGKKHISRGAVLYGPRMLTFLFCIFSPFNVLMSCFQSLNKLRREMTVAGFHSFQIRCIATKHGYQSKRTYGKVVRKHKMDSYIVG